MILAVDVKYSGNRAYVAGVVFGSWADASADKVVTTSLDLPAEYEPGQFYKRELPGILKLVREHDLNPEYLIIDGYVFLDGISKPGLGKRLYDALLHNVAVIGVAKSRFRGISERFELFRGGSAKPLYVTAVGVDLEAAIAFISSMHGKHRIPTMLKKVDHASRVIETAQVADTEE